MREGFEKGSSAVWISKEDGWVGRWEEGRKGGRKSERKRQREEEKVRKGERESVCVQSLTSISHSRPFFSLSVRGLAPLTKQPG